MSSGIGDFVACAHLAHRAYVFVYKLKDAGKEYKELISELEAWKRFLSHVGQLRPRTDKMEAVLKDARQEAASISEDIERYLAKYGQYSDGEKPHDLLASALSFYRKAVWTQSKSTKDLTSRLKQRTRMIDLQLGFAFNYKNNPDIYVESPQSYHRGVHKFLAPFDNVKLDACINHPGFGRDREPRKNQCAVLFKARTGDLLIDFKVPEHPKRFFHPGQVFSLGIAAPNLHQHEREWNQSCDAPSYLEPNYSLDPDANKIWQENRKARLGELLSELPLARMIAYARDVGDRKVVCTFCEDGTPQKAWAKDEWADRHFRQTHWREYSQIRDREQCWDASNKRAPTALVAHTPSIPSTAPRDWITLEDLTSDQPIYSHQELCLMRTCSSTLDPDIRGPVLFRHFVVIQAGADSCLCVGVHTYAGLGCSEQEDQDLFAILHCTTEAPAPLEGEHGIVLPPIRMEADHPEVALILSQASRIHFGRFYGITHKVAVKPLGQIHPDCMEELVKQAIAHVPTLTHIEPPQLPEVRIEDFETEVMMALTTPELNQPSKFPDSAVELGRETLPEDRSKSIRRRLLSHIQTLGVAKEINTSSSPSSSNPSPFSDADTLRETRLTEEETPTKERRGLHERLFSPTESPQSHKKTKKSYSPMDSIPSSTAFAMVWAQGNIPETPEPPKNTRKRANSLWGLHSPPGTHSPSGEPVSTSTPLDNGTSDVCGPPRKKVKAH